MQEFLASCLHWHFVRLNTWLISQWAIGHWLFHWIWTQPLLRQLDTVRCATQFNQSQYTDYWTSIVPEHLTWAEIRERAFTLANDVERAARAYKLQFSSAWIISFGQTTTESILQGLWAMSTKWCWKIKPSSTNLNTDEVWMHLFSLMTAFVCYLTYFFTLAHENLIGSTRVTGFYMAGRRYSVTLLWRVADSVSNVYTHSDNSALLWLIFAWHIEESWIAQQMLLSRVAFVAPMSL